MQVVKIKLNLENIARESLIDMNSVVKKIIKNTESIRIGRITSLTPQENFIRFLVENRLGDLNASSAN